MFRLDPLAFALLGIREWLFLAGLAFFFCVAIAATFSSLGRRESEANPLAFVVIAAIFGAVLWLTIDHAADTAAGIRTALTRPDAEIVVEGQWVEMRVLEARRTIRVLGRPLGETVRPSVIARFPYSRLKAVGRALEQDEALRLAFAEAKERSGCCELSPDAGP